MIISLFQYVFSKIITQNKVSAATLVFVFLLSLFHFGGKSGLWAKGKKALRQQELVNKFPGCGPFSLLELCQLILAPRRDFLSWIENMSIKFGPVFRLWRLGQPKLFITCTETALKLLKNDKIQAKPSEVPRTAIISGGEGLLALTPEVHGPRKKMWLEWISRRNIDRSLERFRTEAVKFCENLEEFAGTGKEFDLMEHALYCTFSTVGNSAFGESFMEKLPKSVAKQYIHDVHKYSCNLTKREFHPWLWIDWIYFYFTEAGRESQKCKIRGNALTKQAIAEKKNLRKKFMEKKDENLPCFLDHLLDLKEKGSLTDYDVLQELNVFTVGGYETTGLSTSYTLYLLSLHPEHQTKCVEEILDIFGENLDKIEEITPGHIKQLKYLEMCIKESLRLFTIFPMAFRRTTDEVVLEDGKIIPEGVDVYMALYLIHRDPKYFPEPEKFIPSRHTSPIPAFMPFSQGSRNCIGQVYAIQQIKMILAHLLMKYKWETTEKNDVVPMFSPVLVPENGLHFKIEKRINNGH